MKISKVTIGEHGSYVMPIPTTSKFLSARQLGNQFEVYYSFATDGTITMLADLRVVDEMEQYDDDYIYIDKVINASNGNVCHVLYRWGQGTPPPKPVINPLT